MATRRRPLELSGLNVVVTGTIAGESRGTAQAKLVDAGAIVQSSVGAKTDLLVTGERVGAKKIERARDLGIEVVPWDEVWSEAPARVARSRPVGRAQARTVAPQLAKAGELPAGGEWLFEIKWDGYRGIATVIDGKVTIQSRSAKTDLTDRFPAVASALSVLPNCVLDGELVDLATVGGSFEGIQNGNGTHFVAFDLLEHRGQDVRRLPLENRRTLLEDLIGWNVGVVQVSPAFDDGENLLDYVLDHDLEGLVAKRRNSVYREGARHADWTKVKVRREQEFVVIGWTPGEGNRAGTIGSLVLAVTDGADTDEREFVYAGRAGSGLDDQALDELTTLLRPIREWGEFPDAPADTTFVVPEVVVQVAFQRWTEDGRLWHPSYKGIRQDKDVFDVVRET